MSTIPLGRFESAVRNVPDFPKPGIVFKDITPLLMDAELFSGAIDAMAEVFRDANVEKILAIESRGFLFGPGVGERLSVGVCLARKPGKLPWETMEVEYDLEYGTDKLQIHRDAISPGDRVLIIDDVLATGGTAEAAGRLVQDAGGVIAGFGFLGELSFLNGREKLQSDHIWSLLSFS
jgi:adenine phosphoribosyltransferase